MNRSGRIAVAAAYGGGIGAAGVGAAALVGYALMRVEARLARHIVGKPFDGAPDDSDVYGSGLGAPIDLVVLGDSLAAGMGADNRFQTIGGVLATGISALAGRPVRLTNVAEIGAAASWLAGQTDRALASVPHPNVALITVGGNDVTHRIDRNQSVTDLARAVARLREAGAEVVVGTCPDLGTIEPIAQPLRSLTRHWSRELAAAQTIAVVGVGGRTVSLGDLLADDFLSQPELMFSSDRFHPSPAGYARAAAALLPSLCAALKLWPAESDREPDRLRGEGIGPVAVAAGKAAQTPGTEVSAVPSRPDGRPARGVWAKVLRRRHPGGLPATTAEDGSLASSSLG